MIRLLLGCLERLAEKNVRPFCDVPILWEEDSPEQDLDSLPESLRYLIGPALHFGERYTSELQMIKFFEEASPQECEQLAALAERIRLAGDWPQVWEWLRKSDWSRTRFAWEISRLFNLIDLCDFSFEAE